MKTVTATSRAAWAKVRGWFPGRGLSSWAPRRKGPLLGAALVLFVALVALGYFLARDESVATLSLLRGKPQRDWAARQLAWKEAKVGERFFEGDGARTRAGESATFLLRTGALLQMDSKSQVRFGRRRGRGAIGLTVDLGQVDLITGDGRLTMDSLFGEIVIEQNSKASISRRDKRLILNVELGHVLLTKEGASPLNYGAGAHIELEIGGILIEPEPSSASSAPQKEGASLTDESGLFDVSIPGGQTATIHDPKPPTHVAIVAPKDCQQGIRVTLGSRIVQGRSRALVKLAAGRHEYSVRCDELAKTFAQGALTVVRDAGTRPLPAHTPSAAVATDGRSYTVYYQERLPHISLSWPAAPSEPSYVLSIDGKIHNLKSPNYSIRSGAMGPGKHVVFFASGSAAHRKSRLTTVEIVRDAVAPLARLSEPKPGAFRPGAQVTFSGQALPGWTVQLNGEPLPQDAQGKFRVEVRADGPLPFVFSHPKGGIHYYVRRPDPK